jgi:diguanylate cyclase (GGDEF)-like protein
VYRVLAGLSALPDYRLVLLAVIACPAATVTAFQCFSMARAASAQRQAAWLLMAGATTGGAIWAAHFLLARAEDPGMLAAYAAPTAAALMLCIGLSTVGFAVAIHKSRRHLMAAAGLLGGAMGLMHVAAMSGPDSGPVIWEAIGILAAMLIGGVLSYAAFLSHARAGGAVSWRASVWLALAACSAHLVDPITTHFVPAAGAEPEMGALSGPNLVAIVAGTVILVMLVGRVALLIEAQANREALVRNQMLVEELSRQNARFDLALSNMPHALSMVDARRHLVVCNRRYAEMYHLPPELTRPGTPISDILEHRIASGLYAGTDLEAYRRERLAPVHEPSAKMQELSDGRVILITRHPMHDGGWIAIHQDITEHERLNARLEVQNDLLQRGRDALHAQNAHLDAALANMTQGLAMFDGEERLVLANQRYGEIYGLDCEHLKPGTTLRQIVEYRIAKGLYPGVSADTVLNVMRERIARKKANHLISTPGDGRILSVSIQPRADGGWVVTLHDITERERLNARLAEQHDLLKVQEEKLRAQNIRMDAALNNMVQGLAMYDRAHRLVMSNKRYAEMYDLTSELVQPGTPLRRIIEHRMSKGEFQDKSADDLIESMLNRTSGRQPAHYTSHLSDGRTVAVSVQPMADGGTVTTHHDISDQRRSEAKIVHMALHDTLTGLPNRVLLNERLEQALSRIKRGELLGMHLLDLDHFKTVNDTLGHPMGDKLLTLTAARLKKVAADTGTIARMGGDEFAILQGNITRPADAISLARRVIAALAEPYELDGDSVVIGTSIGIAVGPMDGSAPDQLIRNADLALYRAKGDGRGTFRFFEPEMDAHMQARRVMENDLRRALGTEEFELHYQPIVNLERNEISGFEALMRWRHPLNGMVSPDTFIPLAEEIGFIIPLGEWVLREACRTAARWPGEFKIAVNLSPVQFRHPGLVQVVTGALAASGLPATRLELEITETALLEDSKSTLSMLYELRALGVRIAMDDFGTGYSSLSYLQSFPFDKIKIDRSFVKGIAESVGSLNIVRAVTALANGLGMITTAEGVETEEQLATIRAEGCTEMQGYVFSPPLPLEEIERTFLAGSPDNARPGRAA